MTSVDPENSWMGALSYFAARHVRFGKDIFFTYGPLGRFFMGRYVGGPVGGPILGALLLAAAAAWVITLLLRRSRSAILAAGLGCEIIMLHYDMIDPLSIATVAATGCFSISPASSIASLALSGGFLATVSLEKFTFFVLAAAVTCIATACHAWNGRAARGAALFGGYAAALIAMGVAETGSIGAFVKFLRGSLELAIGYGYSMAIPASGKWVSLGLAEIGAFLSLLTYLTATSVASRIEKQAAAAVILAALFVAWKESYVRADPPHLICLFATAAYLGVLAYGQFPARTPPSGRRRGAAGRDIGFWLCLTVLVLSGLGAENVGRAEAFFAPLPAWNAVDAIFWRLHDLVHLSDCEKSLGRSLAKLRLQEALPRVKKIVGQHSVDVFDNACGIAVVNGFNYRPRPVFLGYCAYTPYLLHANTRFYLGSAAPKYVLFKYAPIPGRFLAEEDSGTLWAILSRYTFIARERGYALWSRNNTPLPSDLVRRIIRGTGLLGQAVPLPRRARDEVQWLRITPRLSWFGRLRGLLYQPPALTLRYSRAAGRSEAFELPPPVAEEGFIVNPTLRTPEDIPRFLSWREAPDFTAFTVETPDGGQSGFELDYRYGIVSLRRPAVKTKLPR